MTPRAVVFDMDGTLLDSERVALNTFTETCAEFSLPMRLEVYHQCIGHRGEQTRAVLLANYGASFPLDAFFSAWSQRYVQQAIAQPVPVKQGAKAILQALNELNVPVAVATQTQSKSARAKLYKSGLLHHVEFVLGGDQVKQGKPHPEIYLTAAKRLQVDPAQAWAIEDSEVGVRAAHAAGLRVFQIPDMLHPSAELLALGHQVRSSLQAMVEELLLAHRGSI